MSEFVHTPFSHEWWRVTLASIGDGVIATDAAGKIAFLNPTAETLTGWTLEAARGRPLEDVFVIFNELTKNPVTNPVKKVLEFGNVVGLANHTILVTKDGRELPIDDSAAPIRDSNGNLVGVVLIFRDITERRRTELARGYLAAIVESSDDAIVGKTLDGIITSWNRGAETVFGHTAAEAIGRHITIIIPPDRHDEEFEILSRLKRGERIDHFETIRLRKDNSRIVVSLSVSPIHNASGSVIGASKIARDITEKKKAEEALRERERLFHTLAESAPVMVWMSDTDKLCTFFNQRWLEFTGRTMGQELGNGWAEGVHAEDLERCLETYIQAFDSRQEFEMQYRLRRRDGQYRWVTDKGIPLFNSEGVFGGYIGSCTDITDSKHAVEALRVAEEQLRLVTDNMQAAVTQCSRDMRYVWVSPVYAQWLRRNPEEFRRKPIKDIVGNEGYETLRPHIERVLSGKKEEYEEEVHFADIGRRWIHAVYMPTKEENGTVNGWVAVVTDTTSKKQMEHERDQLLAREHSARSKAEEANQIKDEFLATISHELRTPLSAILGWTTLLREGALDQSKARQALEIIERNAKTQAQLIEDLLDVSRIVTGKLRLDVRPVMLASVIESAVSAVKPMAEVKDIRLQSTLDPNAGPVFGDASRLQQVVWNLVNNAIKFTPRGGRVQVRLERINSHLEIAVSDTGMGIPIEFLPHVFDRFRQADSGTTRQHGGLGLGLAIVRQLVELHGGRVSAESAGDGQGSTFRVRLPLMVVHPRQTDEESVHPKVETKKPLAFSSAPRLEGVRVLIIDDEADTRQLLRTVLEKCGAEVRDAGSSEQGLKEARDWKPSIVASDIGMPGHDGYHFIQRFREWERESGSWTPAVALTAYARAEDRVRALAAGYQIHVAKPIDPLEFALIIASQLGRGF